MDPVTEQSKNFLSSIYYFLFPKPTRRYRYVFLPIMVSVLISIFLMMIFFSMNYDQCGEYTSVCTEPLRILPWGGLYPSKILEQPWTIITYSFHHTDFVYLFANLTVMSIILYYLERKYGSIRMFLIYMLSAVGSGLCAWWWWVDQDLVLVGASAAIYGFIGTEAADLIINYESIRSIVWNIVLIVSGLITLIVNEAFQQGSVSICHIVGGVLGLAWSIILIPDFHFAKWKIAPITIAVILILLAYLVLPLCLVFAR